MTSQRSLTEPEARDRPAKDLTLGLIIGRALAQHYGGKKKEGREGEKGMPKGRVVPRAGGGKATEETQAPVRGDNLYLYVVSPVPVPLSFSLTHPSTGLARRREGRAGKAGLGSAKGPGQLRFQV